MMADLSPKPTGRIRAVRSNSDRSADETATLAATPDRQVMIRRFDKTLLADVRSYSDNRSQTPAEDLARYAGQYVAWSPDGRQILASGADPDLVEEQLVAAGVDPAAVVLGFVDPPDEVFLG